MWRNCPMKTSRDKEEVEGALRSLGLPGEFGSPGLDYCLRSYSKGEVIARPGDVFRALSFTLSGSYVCLAVRDDDSEFLVSENTRGDTLGLVEWVSGDPCPFWVVAEEDSTFLTLALDEKADEALGKPGPLGFLLKDIVGKFQGVVRGQAYALGSKERISRHIRLNGGVVESVAKVMAACHVSRRQAQRALAQMVAEGDLERTGKGRYRLRRRP